MELRIIARSLTIPQTAAACALDHGDDIFVGFLELLNAVKRLSNACIYAIEPAQKIPSGTLDALGARRIRSDEVLT